MSVSESLRTPRRWPQPRSVLTLLKPVTWFPPIWAYLCGVVASGVAPATAPVAVLVGMVLAGPVVCGMSQAANDWCDRHVDAINEPDRPIPSGRIPGRWGLWIALFISALALALGTVLGPWGFGATVFGVVAAWAYSAEPIRLKRSGIWGPGLVGLCYEGLPWFTGAAVLGHRVAIQTGHHRGLIAGDVQQDRTDPPTVHRAVVNRGQQDQRRNRIKAQRTRDRDHGRHAVGRAKARQGADDRADEAAQNGQHQGIGRQRDAKAEREICQKVHACAPLKPAAREAKQAQPQHETK